ncbi:hypothetical protein NLJ89_g5272 [Agrocybe chaxingu]|uniref:Uncharacterized protein n=1 Tax=Agrocybe chaxingu TaxID=84603 RepID=A0A9W8K1F7_9AGAR|nr:hypothetical protein NLJ89_g5272 [Agrocybe chaxingu]
MRAPTSSWEIQNDALSLTCRNNPAEPSLGPWLCSWIVDRDHDDQRLDTRPLGSIRNEKPTSCQVRGAISRGSGLAAYIEDQNSYQRQQRDCSARDEDSTSLRIQAFDAQENSGSKSSGRVREVHAAAGAERVVGTARATSSLSSNRNAMSGLPVGATIRRLFLFLSHTLLQPSTFPSTRKSGERPHFALYLSLNIILLFDIPLGGSIKEDWASVQMLMLTRYPSSEIAIRDILPHGPLQPPPPEHVVHDPGGLKCREFAQSLHTRMLKGHGLSSRSAPCSVLLFEARTAMNYSLFRDQLFYSIVHSHTCFSSSSATQLDIQSSDKHADSQYNHSTTYRHRWNHTKRARQ